MMPKTHTRPEISGSTATWGYIKGRLSKNELSLVVQFMNSIACPATRATYLFSLKRFLSTAEGGLLSISPIKIQEWVKTNGSSLPRATIKVTLAALRSFISFTKGQNPNLTNPFEGLQMKLPKIRDLEGVSISHKLLTIEQLRLVLSRLDAQEASQARETPGAFLFKFIALSGMRISETLSLDIFDPSREGDTGYYNYLRLEKSGRYFVRVLGKSRKLREFYLSEELSETVRQHFTGVEAVPGAPVFVTHDKKKTRLTRFGANWEAKQISKKFMNDFPKELSKRFGFHHLRHSICNYLLCTVGVHPVHVAKIMGHSSDVLTRYYLHTAKDIFKDLRMVS